MLNLHLLECTLKGYDHISDLLLAKYWVITGCKYTRCSSLTNITIPDSVTEIEGGAFARCSSLTSVTIGNGVTTIGSYAFYECSSLTSITIPNSVTTIGDRAFDYCNNLAKIVCLATEPYVVNGWSLGISKTTKIYVPEKSVMAYKQDEFWCRYAERIVPIK